MKKWHKWIIAVLVFIIAVVLAVVCFYQFYAKDKIEKVLEKAQVVLKDENLKKEIETFVDDMLESGELDSSQIVGYLSYKEALEAADKQTSDTDDVKSMQAANRTDGDNASSREEDEKLSNYPDGSYMQGKGYHGSDVKSLLSTPSPTSKPKTLMDRVKAEMSAEEFAFAMSVYSRVDINYCLANYQTNRSKVKQHITSVLSSGEISRALEIYGKYSYLLD